MVLRFNHVDQGRFLGIENRALSILSAIYEQTDTHYYLKLMLSQTKSLSISSEYFNRFLHGANVFSDELFGLLFALCERQCWKISFLWFCLEFSVRFQVLVCLYAKLGSVSWNHFSILVKLLFPTRSPKVMDFLCWSISSHSLSLLFRLYMSK